MNYENKYKEALERARKLYEQGTITESICHVFPELKESEDERIRKWIIENIQETLDVDGFFEGQKTMAKKAISWLEKQGEYAKFRNKIQIVDNVTRNQDGVLVNLSQLKRVAKKDEKQGEKKPAWSEEDEKTYKSIIYSFAHNYPLTIQQQEFIKSLRPQHRWKPSDEQVDVLEHFIVYHNSSTNYAKDLEELRLQLKKLMEE